MSVASDPLLSLYREPLADAWGVVKRNAGLGLDDPDLAYVGREAEFAAKALGERMWSAQRAVFEELVAHRRVTVRSCRKGGKTHAAAVLTASYVQTAPTIAVTTAPTHRQVEMLLWGRMRQIYLEHAGRLKGKIGHTSLVVGPEWYAVGFATNEPTRFQGLHGGVAAPIDPDAVGTPEQVVETVARGVHEAARRSSISRLLVVIDEAPGCPAPILEALRGSLIGDNVYALMLGNPRCSIHADHEYARSHLPGSRWRRLKIRAELADGSDPPDPIECDRAFVTPRWLIRPGELEREFPPSTPLFKPYVLGQFSDGGDVRVVIPWQFLEDAAEPGESNLRCGAHVGFDSAWTGEDENVAVFYLDGVKVSEDSWRSADSIASWERLKLLRLHWQAECGVEIPWRNIHVDAAPVAAGILDTARREGRDLDRVDFGGAPTGAWDDVAAGVKFKNRRAEMYWVFRELLRRRMASVPREFRQSWIELTAGLYHFTEGTEIMEFEAKERVKKRLGRSPDHADADVLAFARTPELLVTRI